MIAVGRLRITREEEQQLALDTRSWIRSKRQRAVQRLALSCYGLVRALAADYSRFPVEFDDLVQEGQLGLVTAIQRFDPNRGVRLATYATYRIKREMQRFVQRHSGVVNCGTTADARRIFWRARGVRARLECNGIEPTAERIAKELEVRSSTVADLLPMLDFARVQIGRDEQDARLWHEPVIEAVAEDQVASRFSERALKAALKALTPRQQIIITERYFNPDSEVTLAELGRRFSISRERVRQVEEHALELLRDLIAPMRRSTVRDGRVVPAQPSHQT